MTGFGKGEVTDEKAVTVVQLKSVNNRFLELALKLPSELWAHEAEAKALIQAALTRGKVDIHWKESSLPGAAPVAAALDSAKAKAWLDASQKTARELGLPETLSLESLLRLPGVLGGEGGEAKRDDEAESARRWKAFRTALSAACEQMKSSREREGAALAAEMEGILADSLVRVEGIEAGSLQLQAGFADRMRKRISQILETVGPDDPRVVLEAGLLADKADIREELVRFREHVAEFRRLLAGTEPAGKKLDFLCQELLREANTMGSKSPEAGLTQAVVGLKAQVERLKEQVQNVE